MKNKLEATKFLEEQLNKIHFVECFFISNHGINMNFRLNVNHLDLSKKHPDALYFCDKDRNYLVDYNKRNDIFWLSYKNIWSKLKKEFGLNYTEIKELAKDMFETNFKCKFDTTTFSFLQSF